MLKQKTLGGSFSLSGKGLHTGVNLTVTFNPAPDNHALKDGKERALSSASSSFRLYEAISFFISILHSYSFSNAAMKNPSQLFVCSIKVK